MSGVRLTEGELGMLRLAIAKGYYDRTANAKATPVIAAVEAILTARLPGPERDESLEMTSADLDVAERRLMAVAALADEWEAEVRQSMSELGLGLSHRHHRDWPRVVALRAVLTEPVAAVGGELGT